MIGLIVFLAAWAILAKTCIYKPNAIGDAIIELQDDNILEDGDIIFQISKSSQSDAIQKATLSKYSHCGIIFKKDGKYFVYEAIQPVVHTQLNHWINRGEGNHFVVKRLKDAKTRLTAEKKTRMLEEAKKHYGKDYDLSFEWSDDKMYCSELVWKIYDRGASIQLGFLEELKDFDLSHPMVQKKIEERYGDSIPMNEPVISPTNIFESDRLYTVIEK